MTDTWILITTLYFAGLFVMPWFTAVCVKSGAITDDVDGGDVIALAFCWPIAFPLFAILLMFKKTYDR